MGHLEGVKVAITCHRSLSTQKKAGNVGEPLCDRAVVAAQCVKARETRVDRSVTERSIKIFVFGTLCVENGSICLNRHFF